METIHLFLFEIFQFESFTRQEKPGILFIIEQLHWISEIDLMLDGNLVKYYNEEWNIIEEESDDHKELEILDSEGEKSMSNEKKSKETIVEKSNEKR